MGSRFENYESNKIMTTLTLLNLRFENLYSEEAMTKVNAKEELKSIIKSTSDYPEPVTSF